MPRNANDFLGRGWAYPVDVNRATGQVKLSEYEQDIAQAIRIILSTRCGERVMRPEFGCKLHDYVFELGNLTIRSQIAQEALSALRLWEPRIKDVSVEVEFPEGGCGGFIIELNYVVRSTNNPFNLVYPFFMTEGNT